MQSNVYIAYCPHGPGLMSALFYTTQDANVFGWYTGCCGYDFRSHYFALEHFYSMHATAFYRSVENDVGGKWLLDFSPVVTEVRPPLPDEVAHELNRLQSAFVSEWLFYPGDHQYKKDEQEYHAADLSVQSVNVRFRELARFNKEGPVWSYHSPNTDLNVVDFLTKSWALDDKTLHTHPAPSLNLR